MKPSTNNIAIDTALLAAMITLLVLLFLAGGCEKHSNEPAKVTTQPEAATGEHYLNEKGETVFVSAKPASKPTTRMAGNATCITSECHSNLATARQIHGPVAQRACNACHEEEAGIHKFPLKRTGNATCTFCHSVSGTESHQHKALELGCQSCHSPHVSQAKFLIKADNIEHLCRSCHQAPLKQHSHAPFAKGECTGCHQPHQSPFASLLRGGSGSDHCYTCHGDMKKKLASVSDVHKPAAKDCTSCHSPHASEFVHQLKKPIEQMCLGCHEKIKTTAELSPVKHGAMTDERSCANCHDPHGANEPALLRARTDQLCLTCHDKQMKANDGHLIANMKPVITESKFLHGPNRSGNCSGCHRPHGSSQPQLLDKAFPRTFYTRFDIKKYELCFSCHEKELVLEKNTTTLTNFRDGDVNLHFVHVNRDVKGRTCKACHDVHGSDLPKHLATEVPFEGSGWSMPVDFQQTINGGSCTPGCHTTRTYDRTKLTTRPTTRGAS